MKKTKEFLKPLVFFLALTLVFFVFCFSAAAAEKRSGDYGYVLNNGKAEIVSYYGNAKKLSVPEKLDGKTVSAIGDGAFYCGGFTKVTVPNTVQKIGSEAFASCQELLEVTIGNNVTSIGDSAFSNCQSLKKATLPSKLKKIPDNLFSDCLELKEVNFPSGLTEIGFGAFSSTAITKAPLPNTVKVIGEEAFSWAQNLKSVNLPEGLTEIRSHTFNATTLESVKYAQKNCKRSFFRILYQRADRSKRCYGNLAGSF